MILNNLDTVITECGWYATRGGDKVFIHELKAKTNTDTTSFGAKGTIWVRKEGKKNLVRRGYNIWHISGRLFSHKEDTKDIVAKLKDDGTGRLVCQ